MAEFSKFEAESRLTPVFKSTGLHPHWISVDNKTGIRLRPYNNTWKRKRETGYLIEVEYLMHGKTLMRHVEPWVSYPSDYLIAKLMLLPLEVRK
jgi:hypothetical protein